MGEPKYSDEMSLKELVAEVYTEEGQQIWWDAYNRADDEKKRRMAMSLGLGYEGACS